MEFTINFTKAFLIAIVFFITFNSKAQEKNIENNFIVTLAPLALVDIFDGASIRLGTEVKLKKNISVGVETGTYLDYLKSTKINPKGILIRPFFKYYLNGKECVGKYIGLEYLYKNQDYNMLDSIVIESDRFEKQYGMKRKINSFVLKYGKVKNLGHNFILDWYCGIGIRHIRSDADLSQMEQNGILTGESGDCPIQEDIIRLRGTRIFPDFRLGIKIGYRFK